MGRARRFVYVLRSERRPGQRTPLFQTHPEDQLASLDDMAQWRVRIERLACLVCARRFEAPALPAVLDGTVLTPIEHRILHSRIDTLGDQLVTGVAWKVTRQVPRGICGITTVLPNGATVEAATVGDEGMLGVEAFLRADAVATGDTLIQVPDTDAMALSVNDFRREIETPGAFRDLIGCYTQVLLAQMMQAAACNALHQVHQRCARWLLMTHDRMHGQEFHLSHEFLAVMLGVQHPSVSAVAATPQTPGLIRYVHGRVAVTNRQGLEAASCGCYALIRARFDDLRRGL